MKKISFAIVSAANKNSKDLLLAAKKRGCDAKIFEIVDIVFKSQNGSLQFFCGRKNLNDFDIVIFRGYNNHIYEAKMLARMLKENGKTIIEETLASFYIRGKIQQAAIFSQKNIPHPFTCQALNTSEWKKLLSGIKFPIVAKPNLGRKGRDIRKFNKKQEAIKFFSQNKFDYLAQEHYSVKSDFRIFIVGNEAIGGFERFIIDGEYKSNIPNTPARKIIVDKEMSKIAVEATKACGYEVAGVDLMKYKGKIYIIEINVVPQWEKFKSVTGINPAEHIIEYALKKYLKNNHLLTPKKRKDE